MTDCCNKVSEETKECCETNPECCKEWVCEETGEACPTECNEWECSESKECTGEKTDTE